MLSSMHSLLELLVHNNKSVLKRLHIEPNGVPAMETISQTDTPKQAFKSLVLNGKFSCKKICEYPLLVSLKDTAIPLHHSLCMIHWLKWGSFQEYRTLDSLYSYPAAFLAPTPQLSSQLRYVTLVTFGSKLRICSYWRTWEYITQDEWILWTFSSERREAIFGSIVLCQVSRRWAMVSSLTHYTLNFIFYKSFWGYWYLVWAISSLLLWVSTGNLS